MPVDIISADQLAKVTAGMKTGKKENPKPLVEKVAEAKPVEDAVGKITEKPPVVTDTAPPPQPKVGGKAGREEARSAEAGRREQAEGRAEADREEAGSAQGRSDRGSPEEGREEAAAEAAGPGRASRRSRRSRRPSAPSISRRSRRLLDKRDPSRQAVTGDTLNSNAALGLARARPRTIPRPGARCSSQQVERCWKKPYGGIEVAETGSGFRHPAEARRHARGHAGVRKARRRRRILRVYQESALRAIIECQPYNLPAAFFDEWKYFSPVFTERKT